LFHIFIQKECTDALKNGRIKNGETINNSAYKQETLSGYKGRTFELPLNLCTVMPS